LVFWKAFATFKEGAVTEAIHELGTIQNKRDLLFAICLALAYYHRRCTIPDKEAIENLDKQVFALEKSAGEKSLIMAAQFLVYVNESSKARKLFKAVFFSLINSILGN